jgi:hypothetical protein
MYRRNWFLRIGSSRCRHMIVLKTGSFRIDFKWTQPSSHFNFLGLILHPFQEPQSSKER